MSVPSVGSTLRVVRDSDDLGLDRGTLVRVTWTHHNVMDLDVPTLDVRIACVWRNHPDLEIVA